MDGFERRRDEKKKAIIQTAFELFDQYGFDKVTVEEIAKKAHVSKVSIYNFFESKDNLRRVIIRDIMDETLAEKKALLESDGDFIAKVSGYLQVQMQYYGKHSVRFFFDAVESDTELRRRFEQYSAESREFALRFIGMGKAAGVFHPEISDEAIEIYIDIFQTYFISNEQIREKVEHTPSLANELNVLFLDGLMRQGG